MKNLILIISIILSGCLAMEAEEISEENIGKTVQASSGMPGYYWCWEDASGEIVAPATPYFEFTIVGGSDNLWYFDPYGGSVWAIQTSIIPFYTTTDCSGSEYVKDVLPAITFTLATDLNTTLSLPTNVAGTIRTTNSYHNGSSCQELTLPSILTMPTSEASTPSTLSLSAYDMPLHLTQGTDCDQDD